MKLIKVIGESGNIERYEIEHSPTQRVTLSDFTEKNFIESPLPKEEEFIEEIIEIVNYGGDIKFSHKYAVLRGLPGYFWNLEEEALYSIKIQGVMKKLKKQTAGYYASHYAGIPFGAKYYELSKNGNKTTRSVEWIRNNLIYEDTIS